MLACVSLYFAGLLLMRLLFPVSCNPPVVSPRDTCHRDIINLQVEMVRQFYIQLVGTCLRLFPVWSFWGFFPLSSYKVLAFQTWFSVAEWNPWAHWEILCEWLSRGGDWETEGGKQTTQSKLLRSTEDVCRVNLTLIAGVRPKVCSAVAISPDPGVLHGRRLMDSAWSG